MHSYSTSNIGCSRKGKRRGTYLSDSRRVGGWLPIPG